MGILSTQFPQASGLGEDPYLVGELAKGFVRGLQGDDPRYLQTASTAEHFFAYDEEDHRDAADVTIDERNQRGPPGLSPSCSGSCG